MRLRNILHYAFAATSAFIAAPALLIADGGTIGIALSGRSILTPISPATAQLTGAGKASFFVGEDVEVSLLIALRRDAEPIMWSRPWPELVRWTVDEVSAVEADWRSAGLKRWPSEWSGKHFATSTLQGAYGTAWTRLTPGARASASYSLGRLRPGQYVVSASLDVPNRERNLIAAPVLIVIYRGNENPEVQALSLTVKAAKLPRTGAWFPQYREWMLQAAKLNPRLTNIVVELADTSVGNTTAEESALFYDMVVETVKRNIDANTANRPELKQAGADRLARYERQRERFREAVRFAQEGNGRYKLVAQRDHSSDLKISVIELRSGRSVRVF